MTTTTPKPMTQLECVNLCREFIGPAQMHAMMIGLRGEERQYFRDKFREYGERIANMPKTYETDKIPTAEKTVWLHYFTPSSDFWIVDKDIGTPEEPGQHQAFGLASINGYEPEMGYISLIEILSAKAELDLHFKPSTIAEIKLKPMITTREAIEYVFA